jgi:putative Ca2+/H+ antiporter (TMEM165/GDT1 family)
VILAPLVAAYVAVFLAEVIGDRSMYAISSLATRFGVARVAFGISIAFSMKMGVAVLAGHTLRDLPRPFVAALSATTFFTTAVLLFLKGRRHRAASSENAPFHRAATVSFATIFFTEWADIGQLTAASLAAQFGAPFLVWTGATAAMLTKGAIALAIGVGLRDRLRGDALRYAACAMCVILGVLAALRIE